MKLKSWHRAITVTTFSASAFIAGLTVLFPQAALATNRSVEQITQQLASAAVLMYGDRYRVTHEPTVSTLRDRGKQLVSVNLRSGVTYGLVGVCDNDCADVDLKLYDENYNLIDADIRSNDTPVVTVTPRWSGRYYVEVDMENCRVNYCYYGIGIFGRR